MLFSVGEIVGGVYEIRSLLGEGGMGQVFEAYDHSLARKVAIKVAFPRADAPPLRDEARALAAFRHPSLVTVHALSERHPKDQFVLIIGADILAERDRWHKWDELECTVPFFVVGREGEPGGSAVRMPAVSSSDVRARLAAGESVDEAVPASVVDYIRQHKLYEASR